MKSLSLKKEIHRAVDAIDDQKFLKAVYLILNEKTAETQFELNSDEKKELDNLHKLHIDGKSKSFTMAEVRKYAHSKLKK